MFNNKKNNQPTALDNRISAKRGELVEAENRLKNAAEKVIIANGVISLYPEGADKNHAIEDAEDYKYLLLCAIGVYDGLLRDYKELLKKTEERKTTLSYPTAYCSSHEVIERVYRNFYKK